LAKDIINILSVDLEDHYADLPFSTWDKYESKIVRPTRKILELLKRHNTEATFFILGYIAERHPALIEEIKSQGHEIASHGYSHTNVKTMSRESFERDLLQSLDILRKISGEKVLGFRAPYFSINKRNLWAFDVIKKYFQYDSSIFPVKPHYGLSEAPRHIYRMSDNNPLKEDPTSSFIEIPLATLRLPGIGNVPIAGGFYIRVLPFQLLKIGINKINKSGFPAMCYVHPGEFDTERSANSHYSRYYSLGIKGGINKVECLLKTFQFSSVREAVQRHTVDEEKSKNEKR
jgi:polysaccharide deacetylase family protein (PEP-CTERM system associated)